MTTVRSFGPHKVLEGSPRGRSPHPLAGAVKAREQGPSGTKGHLDAFRNLYGLAGAGIAAYMGGAEDGVEGAKPTQLRPTTLRVAHLNRAQNRVNGALDVTSREVRMFRRKRVDEFGFQHNRSVRLVR